MRKIAVLFMVCCLSSCHQPKTLNKDGGIVLDLEIGDNQSKSNDIAKTAEIIKKRVEMLCVTNPIVTVNSRTIHIEMPLNSDINVCKTFLIQKGDFEIMESYPASEVLIYLSEINKSLVENKNFDLVFPVDSTLIENNPLFNLLSVQTNDINQKSSQAPAIGYVLTKDTALINSIFLHPKLSILLPRDLVFMWAKEANSTEQELFILIAAKKQHREKLITSEMISEAKAEEQNGMNEILITFKQDVHLKWKRITQENIGHSLLMVFDNFVISYPTVQSEIEGGKSSISGNFNIEEARAIAALLKHGVLPLPVKITNIQLVNQKE